VDIFWLVWFIYFSTRKERTFKLYTYLAEKMHIQ